MGVFTSRGGNGPPHRGANAMCEKCDEIDRKIEHYRLVVRQILDREFNDRTTEMIAKLEADKAKLHPEAE
jgi:hypothetical protein